MPKKVQMESMYHFTPSLVGKQVEATYLEQVIPAYRNNPFIESLPSIFEEKYVATNIAKYPEYDEKHRKLGKETRLHLVQQISDYVEPLPVHLLVEQKLSRLIRHGYKARNPFSPEQVRQFHIGFKDILDEGVDEKGVNIAGVRSTAAGFAILGVSGQGKTTAIESSLLLYPQVIHHSTYRGQPFIRKQLVWLKLNCPFDGSLRGLCFNFFQAVDANLGTNYFQKFVSKGTSVDILIPIMAHIATLHGLGVLVIDEIQNLSFLKSGGAEKMLNYFTQLINTIGVPVVLIGTFKAMKLLSGSFSQARRSTGQGDLIMARLEEGEEWDYFLQRLWRYQWTANVTKLSNPIKKAMYELSQGIIDIAVKLYMLAQWEAIDNADGNEKITVSLLNAVVDRHMQLVKPLLNVLKLGDPKLLAQIDDLYPKWNDLDHVLKNSVEKVNIHGELKKHLLRDDKIEQDKDKYIELVKTALEFGAPIEIAEDISKKLLKKSEEDADIVKLRNQVVKEVNRYIESEEIADSIEDGIGDDVKKTKEKNKKGTEILDEDDLRNVITNKDTRGQEIYEKLVEMGKVPDKSDIEKLII
ncbi:MAG TPA: ATP-binding protein [Bacillus sp. (in: firmicutes)]|nr:ATP-binding protein [Bacillus sp. (in: firmicutes)]